jgi:hypothetical protein
MADNCFADNSPLPSHHGNGEEKTMLLDRAPIKEKEPIKMHLKFRVTNYLRTVYAEKGSTPPPQVSVFL